MSQKPFISFKLGVKKDAEYKGGLNIFGKKFVNYDKNIIMKVII